MIFRSAAGCAVGRLLVRVAARANMIVVVALRVGIVSGSWGCGVVEVGRELSVIG
jgi:hypothetical protein